MVLPIESLRAPALSFLANQPTQTRHTECRQPSHVPRTYASPRQVTPNQTPTIPPNQRAPAAYAQTTQLVSHAPNSAPLVTLGPNDNFDEMVYHASGVVLVDFYADWCGPCRKQGDILHEMERSAGENHASIIKVNIDQHKYIFAAPGKLCSSGVRRAARRVPV